MSNNLETIPEGGVTYPKGFSAGAVYAGIKKKSRDVLDLAILYSETSCSAAAVFTTNKVKAAPVILDQQKLQKTGKARAVIVNSGCANACTGERGLADAALITLLAAKNLNIPEDEVLAASTGVIGVPLPVDLIERGISQIALSKDGGRWLARAIMTTDTRPKEIAITARCENCEFSIGGAAKGAGMIHPNMATMLCFLTTDAEVEPEFLQTSLQKAVDASFNMISVDGDTSTNDTVLLLASGLSGKGKISQGTATGEAFQMALEEVCLYLAKCIVRDGEGATRLIEVAVNGASSSSDAKLAARTIASSPLVKAAIHGADPNWGRILAAAGRSGAELITEKSAVYIDDLCLLNAGMPLPFDKKAAAQLLKGEEVKLRVELNLGSASATAWGCDLSEEYVVINSEYTT